VAYVVANVRVILPDTEEPAFTSEHAQSLLEQELAGIEAETLSGITFKIMGLTADTDLDEPSEPETEEFLRR
jgi:hypothetical protein